MNKYISIALVLLAMLLSFSASSNQLPTNISPLHLEQFRKLPPSQQKALAQSMGLDYKMIRSQLNKTSSTGESTDENKSMLYPRGTAFDEEGNPTLYDEEEEFNQVEVEEDRLKPFGYDVFANEPNTFTPSMDFAIPSDYLIGAGDMIMIQLFGKENEELELEVTREGQVIVPKYGPFTVAGLTLSEAKKYLSNEIKEKGLGVDIVVTLSELRSIRVFVLGGAYKPGQYVLNALSSVTHAILAAGGFNDVGSLRNVQVKRAGKLIKTLDLYDLLIRGDSSGDVLLKSNDVVFISAVGDQVTVDGEVKRPAIYELKNGETFKDVIEMAGGMLPSAYPAATVVERFNERNLRTVRNFDFSQSAINKVAKAGDFINVLPTSEQFEDSVTLVGAVTRPGKYQWHEQQRVTDLIPNINSYLLEEADLAYSIIVREKDIGRNIEVLQFSLFNAISAPNGEDNITLQPRDKVLVFSHMEKQSHNLSTLDSLAATKSELLEREKEQAEENYQTRRFWEFYSGQNSNTALNKAAEIDQAEETLKQTYKSIEELTGVVEEKPTIRELSFFSRKRLLAPVIDKLKTQSGSGDPIMLVEIDGAVKYPGLYPLASNGTLKDAVSAAGGLLESAFLRKAEVTRNDIVEEQALKRAVEVNLADALSGEETANIKLKSKDRINIHHIPSWQENHIVELKGEFKFPGKYTIRRGESLGELIERVGGFTEYANVNASLFTREKLKQMELENLIKVSESLRMEMASKNLASRDGRGVDYNQAKKLLADLTRVEPIGRLVVDIPHIIKHQEGDVILEDGDVLYIPTKQNSINVVGQVQVASSHVYDNNLGVFDYVELSGGMKSQADQDRVYVIKANGKVHIPSRSSWFASTHDSLEPGDTVVVPLDSYFVDDLSLWQAATQIIFQASVAIATITKI